MLSKLHLRLLHGRSRHCIAAMYLHLEQQLHNDQMLLLYQCAKPSPATGTAPEKQYIQISVVNTM